MGKRMNTRAGVDQSGNIYCGPLVMAAILGISTGEAAAEIRKDSPYRTAIKGTRPEELFRTLRRHGFEVYPMRIQKDERTVRLFGKSRRMLVGPTMVQWFKSDSRVKDAVYIVDVSNHWVLVKGRKTVDTFTRGEWVFFGKCPHRRKRVNAAYVVL